MMIPGHNETVNVEDLVKLNDALRKSNVGYQTPAGTAGGENGALSPLVPQSIEGSLSSATHTMQELSLWPMMPKTSVSSTLHEYVVVNDHGFDIDPFIGEGGGAEQDFVTNNSQYERKSVKIKYMAERRQVSDVASLVGMIGDNRNAIAEETMRGTMGLMRKVERQLWYGNESLQEKGFDGILKQVRDGAPQNVLDLKGSAPTPLLLQEALGEVYSAPNFGRPDCIYVEPRMHAELIKQSVESGRHDQFQVAQSGSLTFGQSQLNIMAPYGAVPVKAAPFLHFASRLPASGFGSLAPAAPTITSAVPGAETVAGSSQFVAGDPTYKYAVVAVGDQGFSAPKKSVQINVNADEEVVLTIAATNLVRGASQAPRYYRIYRSGANQDGIDSSYRLIAEIPCAGGAAATVFTDLDDGNNGQKYGCSPILFAQHDPQVMEFVRLLDFIRRPLAETASVKPFLLMLFGSPVVKVPGKMFLMDNAGLSTTDLIRA
jgi:hypothetical protein